MGNDLKINAPHCYFVKCVPFCLTTSWNIHVCHTHPRILHYNYSLFPLYLWFVSRFKKLKCIKIDMIMYTDASSLSFPLLLHGTFFTARRQQTQTKFQNGQFNPSGRIVLKFLCKKYFNISPIFTRVLQTTKNATSTLQLLTMLNMLMSHPF